MDGETPKREEATSACCAETTEEMNLSAGHTDPCPMSTICKGAMEKGNFSLFLAIPGIALLLVGALILLKPTVLVWFVAGMSIVLGIGMLAMAVFASRLAHRSAA